MRSYARMTLRVLYISYDGLTDFIGQSQVLPYLIGSARQGHSITVLSFEKPERFDKLGPSVQATCQKEGLKWEPQRFRTSPPFLAKFIDQLTMERAAIRLASSQSFDLVHCRSYVPAVVGWKLKRRFGFKLLFDMRGFWPDQRREGGRWQEGSPIGRHLFARWKRHEAELVRGADHIVALTKAAKEEIGRWNSYSGAPVSVIPCCTDFSLFRPASADDRELARRRLGIPDGAPVLAYLGSLGTVYLLDHHLLLFDALRKIHPQALMLFVGRDSVSYFLKAAARRNISLSAKQVRVVQAERSEVPFWIGAADAGTCFITPTYSSLGVSPTKLGEYLACGVPVYSNPGIGDVELILARTGGGHLLPDTSTSSLDAAAREFSIPSSPSRDAIRGKARKMMDLPRATEAYNSIYENIDRSVDLIAP